MTHTVVGIKTTELCQGIPSYANPGDAGADLRASERVTIKPGEVAHVPTGVHVAIPRGVVGFVNSRSGLARSGVFVANSPGTIDSGYRGEVGVLLYNSTQNDFIVDVGNRIAQLVLVPFLTALFSEEAFDNDTKRGQGGFGSTGL